ncbi:hypothetical protein J3998_03755 [Thiomicrorhabdus sp. 6S2-11]|uniref:Uncharacterized protein n=1 Tax=Thiomicrorhabdus marina TaxID=2818442 RepID=A0ABS3Q2X1_9GAMM|nr:hypothetical protein [Thiomicrorhabdus marina]MBO1926683.1 hypothetical protein [Thiomicrorhabdus marina]
MKSLGLERPYYSLEEVAKILSKYDLVGAVTVEDVRYLAEQGVFNVVASVTSDFFMVVNASQMDENRFIFSKLKDIQNTARRHYNSLEDSDKAYFLDMYRAYIKPIHKGLSFVKNVTYSKPFIKHGLEISEINLTPIKAERLENSEGWGEPFIIGSVFNKEPFTAYGTPKSTDGFIIEAHETGAYYLQNGQACFIPIEPTIFDIENGRFFWNYEAMKQQSKSADLFISREEVAAYLEAPTSTDQQTDTPPYLDPNSPIYAPDIDLAIQAHKAAFIDNVAHQSVKGMTDWLMNKKGIESTTRAGRIAITANPNKRN